MIYRIPSGVTRSMLKNRPLLSTREGGRVAIDSFLLSLWEHSDGRSLNQILQTFTSPPGVTGNTIRAALACLSEAGLLSRSEEHPARPLLGLAGRLVTVVVVAYNSRDWLARCLPSLRSQTYAPLEIVVVDNASTDDSVSWVAAHYPDVKLLTLKEVQPFAKAVNIGVEAAKGDFFFLLNPDVGLEPDALAHLVAVAQSDINIAAVGAKLKFWWAPAFLNGLGNRVDALSWGSDNCLGHLDLGQFDHWEELPSPAMRLSSYLRRLGIR
jgi:hypothetical protein